MKVSVIIPVLNEVSTVCGLLSALQPLRDHGHELIVVDGGSTDGTLNAVAGYADMLCESDAGRSRQMNFGAQKASGEILWFLHADTELTSTPEKYVQAMRSHPEWGRFDVRLSGKHFFFRTIEFLMNWRSRWSGIATGDQGIYVLKSLFNAVNGFEEIPIMEDIRLSAKLKSRSRPACHRIKLITSSRRWEQEGMTKTVLLMWYLRLAHFLGMSPEQLVKKYYR